MPKNRTAPDRKIIQELIKDPVGPIIMSKFSKMTQQDMHTFLSEHKKGYVLNVLAQNQGELIQLRDWLSLVPLEYREKLHEVLLDKSWIKYYLESELKTKRPDLYIEITFNHGAIDYILNEISLLLNHVM